jgi:NAD+ kinase
MPIPVESSVDTSRCPGFRCEKRLTLKLVAIITKPENTPSAHYAEVLSGWLKNRGVDSVREEINENIDMVIVLGGDGTLLHIADQAARHDIPVLGINFGHLGFLSDITEEEAFTALERVLRGEITIENRQMLASRLITAEGESEVCHCLNDIVIAKNVLARLLTLATTADGRLLNTYRADGLIISTPSGSTAWNLSAGGPLVYPGLATTVITPICPFMLSSRPIILPAAKRLHITLKADIERDAAQVIMDGRARMEISNGDTLEICTASHPLQLVVTSNRDWFSILRSKLHWGEGRDK